MELLDSAQDSHQEVYGNGGYDNQAKFSHELIAGGAAFEGFKLFEDHQRKEGKQPPLTTCYWEDPQLLALSERQAPRKC